MYGPRDSYVIEACRRLRETKAAQFRCELIAALRHPDVRSALAEAVRPAHPEEAYNA